MTSLVDEKGYLLPPEQCNIKPLECLTKDRAPSPVRRSPTRNGQNSPAKVKTNLKLPNFSKEVYLENHESNLKSPIALKGSGLPKEEHTTNSDSGEVLTGSIASPDAKISSFEFGVKKKRMRMKSSEEGSPEEIELLEKPIHLWTTEDVCIWLEFVDLQKLKDNFINQKVTGKTLLNLNYETLERLNLSKTSEEREDFLGAVYELQQEHEQSVADHDNDKEIEETLKGAPEHGINNMENDKGASRSHTSGSDVASSGSMASSSQTGSDHSPTPEANHTRPHEEKVHVSAIAQNKGPKASTKQGSPSKTSKDPFKHGEKKRKSRTKRISRFWSSFQGHKNSPALADAPAGPIQQNVFHNLMNTGPQGVIKVWTEMFLTDMQYVSLLIRHDTTAAETVKMVLEKSNAKEDPECYQICEIDEKQNEHILDKNECPLPRERRWSDPEHCRFELRWRNERLIEWSGDGSKDVPKDISFEKPEPPSLPTNGDERLCETVSSPTSPESDVSKHYTQTKFDYNVEIEYKDAKEPHESLVSDGEHTTKEVNGVNYVEDITPNGVPEKVDEDKSDEISTGEPGSLLRAHKHKLTSSCPDLTSTELFEGNADQSSDMGSSRTSGTEGDDYQRTFEDEREYSHLLRTSSKNLSGKLRFKQAEKARNDGHGIQAGIKGDNVAHEVGTVQAVTDAGNKDSGDSKEQNRKTVEPTLSKELDATVPDRVAGDNSGTEGEIITKKVALEEESSPHIEETGHKRSSESREQATQAGSFQELEKLQGRVKEVGKENSLLIEDNRELKKSCRTFEGKSRLKERELEEMEAEKNELSVQMKEMVDNLHSLRSENAELRASLSEAKTKIGDVNKLSSQVEEMADNLDSSRSENAELRASLSEAKTKLSDVDKLSTQVKEMADNLDSLRSENAELRANLAEANTKLGDVDGWVTREVFEDIRGQLSLSSEEVEKKEEEVLEIKRAMAVLENENKKITVLQGEVDKLNERIKEDQQGTAGMRKDAKDKETRIHELAAEIEKVRASVKKRDNEKDDLEKKLKDAENQMSEMSKKQADGKKDLQKKLSDREYEILIMKEEKKEICAKLKSLEGKEESLQEEIKKKDSEHSAVLAEMKEQSDIKDESLSVTVSTLEQLVTDRDQRIKQLKKQLSDKPQGELQAKEHEYEQNKLYLKHLIALVREKDPKLLELLNKTLKSRDKDDWC